LTNSGSDKKYVTSKIIVNKTVYKEEKRRGQKQETGNKQYIVDETLLFKLD